MYIDAEENERNTIRKTDAFRATLGGYGSWIIPMIEGPSEGLGLPLTKEMVALFRDGCDDLVSKAKAVCIEAHNALHQIVSKVGAK